MTVRNPGGVVGSLNVTLEDVTLSATASTRNDLSTRMLLAARRAALRVREVEEANSRADFGSWFDGIFDDVPTAVVMAAAALEAAINETLTDYRDDPAKFGLTRERATLLGQSLSERSGNTREKCRQIALILDRAADAGRAEWMELGRLLGLRNRLMHFRPRWDHDPVPSQEQKAASELVASIGGPCRFFAGSPLRMPHAAFTYGCAKWAVETVRRFSADFAAHLEVRDRFARLNLALP